MNFELVKITEWLESNRLSLNVSKTHYMLFKWKGMHAPIITEGVLIREVKIDYVKKTKFLVGSAAYTTRLVRRPAIYTATQS